jgi:hypothetical protein
MPTYVAFHIDSDLPADPQIVTAAITTADDEAAAVQQLAEASVLHAGTAYACDLATLQAFTVELQAVTSASDAAPASELLRAAEEPS